MSDRLAATEGDGSLGIALLITALVFGAWGAFHLLWSARTLRADLAAPLA